MREVAKWLSESRYTVILTGAGMSTESGLPDFRSKDGWWKQIDPMKLASTDALLNNYEQFREFYQVRIEALNDCEPHEGHHILAEWEKQGLVQLVATQNVDGFHHRSGSKEVVELHGNIYTTRCQSCRKEASINEFMAENGCSYCDGRLRPNVVLFGEMLPEQAWQRALMAMQKADLVIVIGTSLQVYPVNQLPMMSRGKLVYINADVDEEQHAFHKVIVGKAKETLIQLAAMVGCS